MDAFYRYCVCSILVFCVYLFHHFMTTTNERETSLLQATEKNAVLNVYSASMNGYQTPPSAPQWESSPGASKLSIDALVRRLEEEVRKSTIANTTTAPSLAVVSRS